MGCLSLILWTLVAAVGFVCAPAVFCVSFCVTLVLLAINSLRR